MSLALSVWQSTQELTGAATVVEVSVVVCVVALVVAALVVVVVVVPVEGSTEFSAGLHPTSIAAVASNSPTKRKASRFILTSFGSVFWSPCRPGVRAGTGWR